MGLNAKEKKLLERLQAKAEEPDRPSVGRTLSASIDLSDPKQVKLAQRYGFLDPDDEDEEDEDEEESDETPKRRGYFGDDK